jgi:hypothetical protein
VTEDGAGLLWTALPVELVVEGMEPVAEPTVEMAVEGRLLLVRPGPDGTGSVERLISCSPQDYLDPRWQPGARVPLHQR